MKQLIRHRVATHRPFDRRRERTANPAVASELWLIVDRRQSESADLIA